MLFFAGISSSSSIFRKNIDWRVYVRSFQGCWIIHEELEKNDVWKIQFQKTCHILFEWRYWWVHSWISQHQSFSFHETAPVKDSVWKDENCRSYLKSRCHFCLLTEEKSVWINNCESDGKCLLWKMCFHNHLRFSPRLQEPCWGDHEVQRTW